MHFLRVSRYGGRVEQQQCNERDGGTEIRAPPLHVDAAALRCGLAVRRSWKRCMRQGRNLAKRLPPRCGPRTASAGRGTICREQSYDAHAVRTSAGAWTVSRISNCTSAEAAREVVQWYVIFPQHLE